MDNRKRKSIVNQTDVSLSLAKHADLRKSIINQTDVSFSLFKSVVSVHTENSNLVFSPISLHIILGLIASGSSGSSQVQFLSFLKYRSMELLNFLSSQVVRVVLDDGEALGGPTVSFANGVWVDRSTGGLKAPLKQIVENYYMAVSSLVDFQHKGDEVIKEVNTWADRETNGLIQEILPPGSVDVLTKLIYANTLYFRGAWSVKFTSYSTKERDFFLLNGSSVRTPFMSGLKWRYVRAFDGFKVLGLPYEQGRDNRRFSMYIYLPDAKDGLSYLINKISSTPGFIEHHLPYEKVLLNKFRIPKFKIGFGFEASEVLKARGVVLPFNPLGGGLSNTVNDPIVGEELYVSGIFQKSFIEVNEVGTTAAAVSLGRLSGGGGFIDHETLLNFVADHPFLFVIREDSTGVVLFIGQLLNPIAG